MSSTIKETLEKYGFPFSEDDQQSNSKYYSMIENVPEEIRSQYLEIMKKIKGERVKADELPFIPPSLYSKELISLTSRYGTISEIDTKNLENWRYLERLILSNNTLDRLPDLRSLSSLLYLDVSHNDLEEISLLPDDLSTLIISHNKLSKLEEIPSLIYLDVSYNALSALSLPPVLQYCDASHNSIETISLSPALTILILDENRISSLDLRYCLILSQVSSSRNQISELKLAKDSEYYKNIRFLDLEYNELETLPDNIGKMVGLKILKLAYNNLRHLPETIGKLSALEILTLKNNILLRLPETMSRLSLLSELDLSNNLLAAFPKSLGDLNLRVLDSSKNKLSNVTLKGMKNLEELYLDSNAVNFIELGIEGPLKIVDLSNNDLKNVPEYFLYYGTLESLYLINNNLESLPSRMSGIAVLF